MNTLRLRRDASGFTLLEIMTVIILIAILSSVALVRTNSNFTEPIAEMDLVKTHLRYAQSRAMAESAGWYVSFNAGTDSYRLFRAGDGQPKAFPGEDSTTVTLESLNVTGTVPGVVYFDYLGRPFSNTGGTSALPKTTMFTLDSGQSLVIHPETGFIP